jgi:hypothetical protein
LGVFHNESSANRRGAVSVPGGVTGGATGGVGAVGAGTVVVTAGRVVVGAAVVVVGATVVDVGAGADGALVADGGTAVATGGPAVVGAGAGTVVVLGAVTAVGGVSESPGCTGTSSRHVDDVLGNGSSGRKPASRISARCSPLQRPLEPSPSGSAGWKPTAATIAPYDGERADTTVYR